MPTCPWLWVLVLNALIPGMRRTAARENIIELFWTFCNLSCLRFYSNHCQMSEHLKIWIFSLKNVIVKVVNFFWFDFPFSSWIKNLIGLPFMRILSANAILSGPKTKVKHLCIFYIIAGFVMLCLIIFVVHFYSWNLSKDQSSNNLQ